MPSVKLRKNIPVNLTLRLPEELKESLGKESARTGISMNGLIIQHLEEGLLRAQLRRNGYRSLI
jgi:ribbon-helix-helix protein, copG family